MDGWMGNVSSKQANDKQRINIKPSQPQMRCGISFISWLAYCMFYATKTKQTKKIDRTHNFFSSFIINIQTRQQLWVFFLLEATRFLWLLQLSPLSVKLF